MTCQIGQGDLFWAKWHVKSVRGIYSGRN